MSEASESQVRTAVDAARGIVHDKFIFPISQKGYEHIQDGIGQGIRDEGFTLQQAVDTVYGRMGARLTLHPEDAETAETLQHGAGIFVGNNQDFGANFQYLRAVKDRPTDDVSFFEKAVNVPYWDASAQEHILPVYYDISLNGAHGYLAEKIRRSPDYAALQALTPDERRERNRQTLSTAAERIAEGGIVTIFPSGGGDETAEWKRGVGGIVQQLGEKRPDAKLIMGYLTGTSPYDKYKLAPGVRKITPVQAHMYVSAVDLKDTLTGLPQDADSKAIATHMRETYLRWVGRKKAEEKGSTPGGRMPRHFQRVG